MGLILSAETYQQFGYYPQNISYGSAKLVIWKCEGCQNIFEKQKCRTNRINICLQCSNKINANKNLDLRAEKVKEWHSKNDHPLLGTQRPQHVKDALLKARLGIPLSDERKAILSIKNSGSGNPFYGKKHTTESLAKMCEYQRTHKRTGKDCNLYGKIYHGKGKWYKCVDGSEVWMRSSWEIKFAEYLDKNEINWLYEPKQFPITYNNKEGTYSPDFYLMNENKYIEIKGWWRDDAKIKYDAFINQYPYIKIELYQKQELKKMNIL